MHSRCVERPTMTGTPTLILSETCSKGMQQLCTWHLLLSRRCKYSCNTEELTPCIIKT